MGTTGTLDGWDFTVHYQRTFERSSIGLGDVRDFSAGLSSNLSFGLSDKLLDSFGDYGYRDQSSSAHRFGGYTGTTMGFLAGGKASVNFFKSPAKEFLKPINYQVLRKPLVLRNVGLKKGLLEEATPSLSRPMTTTPSGSKCPTTV